MIFGVTVDVFRCDVSFAVDTNEKELKEFFKKNPDAFTEEERKQKLKDFNDPDVAGVVSEHGTNLFCLLKKKAPADVAHEIFHVAYKMLAARGVDDEETTAYLIGYLTEQFYEWMDPETRPHVYD